jgi:hypothetical protein
MQYQTEILRFREGSQSRDPSPDATVAAARPNALLDAGNQIAVLVDLTPQLPYRSREIRTLVVKTYWASSGSIVARLRRALAAANRHLIDFNVKAAAGDKCAGNITCAVFSGEELFLGQVGAAYAFVYHPHTEIGSQFELFPKRDRLLIPLGSTTPAAIHIGYTLMSPGSIACLVTTGIAESQARENWEHVLAFSKVEEVSSRLKDELTSATISGSIILAGGVASPAPKPAPWAQRRPVQPAPADAAMQPASLTPIAATERSRVSRRRRPDELEDEMVAEAPSTPVQPVAALPEQAVVTEATVVSPELEEDSPSPAETVSTVPSPVEAPPDEVSVSQPEPRRERRRIEFSPPPVGAWLRQATERAKARRRRRKAMGTERATTAERARLRQALRSLLPGKVSSAQKALPKTPPPERTTVMAGLALGLFLVVLLITLTKYFQLGGPLRAEELLAEAQVLRDEAYRTQDPDAWQDLLDTTSQIVRLDPQNLAAQAMHEEAKDAVETLGNAAMLSVSPLLDLGTAPIPRRLIVAGGWVYILNTATDAVMALPLSEDYVSSPSESPTTILRRGQTYLGETVNRLVDFAWVKPGGNYPDGAVLIYSEGGKIFIYEPALGPGSITVQQIEGDLSPGSVTAMETFGDRFYLVNRQLNQILFYEPVNGIYESPRMYFPESGGPDLQQTLDIAIDGRLYLLMGNGSIQTYFAGTYDNSFKLSGLPDAELEPLVMAIEPDPDEGLVYLGDTPRERIIVLNKQGEFSHQFRLPKGEMKRIEALAINLNPHVLFLIAENRLYASPLPSFGSEAGP